MIVRQTFECDAEHRFDKIVKSGIDKAKCPECGGKADILWIAEKSYHSHLKDAVVVFRMADGSFSFPGSNTAKTPKGAERMEMRKAGEVRQLMKRYNDQMGEKERRKDERYMEAAERQNSERRKTLHHLMGNETDAAARDLYREALNRAKVEQPERYREYYNEACE